MNQIACGNRLISCIGREFHGSDLFSKNQQRMTRAMDGWTDDDSYYITCLISRHVAQDDVLM
jgi:hypothetical protein